MFKGRSDHIVLACKDIQKTREFYEITLNIPVRTVQPNYVTYDLGGFYLCFKETTGVNDVGSAVVHLGIDFKSRNEVESYYEMLQTKNVSNLSSKITGGPGQGPYRFYVKDPDGYTLEFETWEGSSD